VALAARRHSLEYGDAEKEALFAQRGIWAADFIPPAAFRAAVRAAAESAAAAAGSRVIKGRISADGRSYHLPGQERDAARDDPPRGRRAAWCCTVAEARAAGWRRARR
jgi:hypothetical protein